MHVRFVRVICAWLLCSTVVLAEEQPYGKGMTDANKDRLLLDDMLDVSDWENGSPIETRISASRKHVRDAQSALLFANVVDHTQGEKLYPVGWPRVGKSLVKPKLTDWTGYDYFECWVYVETSRESLPNHPLGIGFYHPGPKRSSSFPLDVKKDDWTRIVIPIAKLLNPAEIQRVQFNISESNYKHGDRVDFYLCDVALTRFVQPAIAEFEPQRRVLFGNDRWTAARYKLVGREGLDTLRMAVALGRGEATAAQAQAPLSPVGEITLPLSGSLEPGDYQLRLEVRDAQRKLVDRQSAPVTVVAGPFQTTAVGK